MMMMMRVNDNLLQNYRIVTLSVVKFELFVYLRGSSQHASRLFNPHAYNTVVLKDRDRN